MENQQGFFSRKLRAGKRRTYFFDVRSTKQGDYFVTITESKRRFDRPGYDSHKIFLYKEDFKKFGEALEETLNHIRTELNPEFDYDSYDREAYQNQGDDNDDFDGDDEEDYIARPVEREKKEPAVKFNARPNKDLMNDYPKEKPRSIFGDSSEATPPSDEAMEW
ncbi:MAG: DUF3276 family protein [Chitinophagales bacterium]|nr:DUF3276 family protein [Chitinophagales bacterium]